MQPGHDSRKQVTRREIRHARRLAEPYRAADVERALADRAAALPVVPGLPVAVYVSLPAEPGTGALRRWLRSAGHRVLLPVLRDDLDLDWVADVDQVPDDADREAILRPVGPLLGPESLTGCGLVLVPALAVDTTGTRLGQGGGSYDRALARRALARRAAAVTAPAPAAGRSVGLVLAVVHDHELHHGAVLPRDDHDVGVDGALTASGVILFR